MYSVQTLIFAVFCPALLGLIGMMAPRRSAALRVWLGVLAPALSLGILVRHAARHGLEAGAAGIAWMPSLQLELWLNPDHLGLFFAMLVAGMGVPIALYARAYFGPDQNALYRLYPILLLFMTAMLGLVLSDNFLLLLLFWELTSISSFLLIGWERDDPAAVKNALQAFAVTGIGGLALLCGLILLGQSTGVWRFSELTALHAASGPGVTAAFVLIFAGAAAKSAQWPLHFWLPGAMAAPTPISAYLHSATMVKAGVYLFGRLADPMAELWLWPWMLIPVGTVTMVLAAYVAVRKSDLKLIFAYTTVSQLGLMVCMYGMASFRHADGRPTMLWDVTQIFSHALYKAPLFIIAGAIAHVAYSRDLRDLYGLFHQGRRERLLVILMLLAGYAMAAGPLTLGFTAKEFFLHGVCEAYQTSANPLFIVVLAAVVCQSALNVVILVRLGLTFLGPESGSAMLPPHDPLAEEERIAFEDYHAVQTGFWTWMLWIPAAAIIILQYVGGLWPGLFDWMFGVLEQSRGDHAALPGLWHAITHPGVPLVLSGLAVVLGVVLALGTVPLGRAPIWRRSIHDWHDTLWPRFYRLVTVGGRRLFGTLQTGNLRLYLGVICTALVLLVPYAVYLSGTAPELSRRTLGDGPSVAYAPFYALGVVVCVGALLMPFIYHRGGRVMLLGTVGYTVAGLFYLYSAPDVALTQVAIEIVGLILFLLALSLLPRTLRGVRERVGVRGARLALSVGVGIVMGWMVMSGSLQTRPQMSVASPEGRPFAFLGDFFLRNSYIAQDMDQRHPGGGGNNVVNVILVDFRGFDTLGEITVLAAAGVGVLVLLHRRKKRGRQAVEDPTPESAHANDLVAEVTLPAEPLPPRRRWAGPGPGPWRHGYSLTSEPLRVATRLLVPLSLLFAAFVFLKGHQTPGGGFVAGLIGAVALVAHRMAHGRTSLRYLMRVRARTLIGVGLLLAVGTGVAAMLMDRPFLTSRYGYLEVPGTSQRIEWTTVLAFDLGVFLVVIGVVLMMINALSEEAEAE